MRETAFLASNSAEICVTAKRLVVGRIVVVDKAGSQRCSV